MRKTVAIVTKGLYLLLTEMIAVYLIAFPVHAFQVSSSSTGYVRVATPRRSRLSGGESCGVDSTVASATADESGLGGGAARHGAGRVGALGGVGRPHVGEMYYSAPDVQAVKTAASPASPRARRRPTRSMETNYARPSESASCGHPCAVMRSCIGSVGARCMVLPVVTWAGAGTFQIPLAWMDASIGRSRAIAVHAGPNGARLRRYRLRRPQQVADYLTGLPAVNPNCAGKPSHARSDRGTTTPADNVTTNPVTPSRDCADGEAGGASGTDGCRDRSQCPGSSGAATSGPLDADHDDDHHHDDQSGWIGHPARRIDQLGLLFSGES